MPGLAPVSIHRGNVRTTGQTAAQTLLPSTYSILPFLGCVGTIHASSHLYWTVQAVIAE
jgi:hypothetical protein